MLSSLNPSNQRELTIPPDRWHPADPKYPGLGLPLRHDRQDNDNYPLGAHGNCFGSQSFILPIRELAMMSVMERLTDKENWHNKVFDEDIVSKWRNEALAIPDEEFWSMAFRAKEYRGIDAEDEEDGGYVDGYWHSHDQGIEGILDDATFDFVSPVQIGHVSTNAKNKVYPRTASKGQVL